MLKSLALRKPSAELSAADEARAALRLPHRFGQSDAEDLATAEAVLAAPLQATISQLEQDISIALTSLDGIRAELDGSIAEHVALSDHIRSEGDGVAEVVQQVEQSASVLSAKVQNLSQARDVIQSESQRVMQSVDDASHRAHDAHTELKELVEAIAAIAGVVGLIDRVSKDTRLLALNAAIEARRVGTHGRAFGVIADEVKTLAEDTAKATADITQKIVRLNTSAASSMTAIARMVDVAAELRPSFGSMTKAVATQDETIGQINGSTDALVKSTKEAAARADGLREFTGVAVHEAESIKLASNRLADFMGQFTRRLTTSVRQNEILGRRKEPRTPVSRSTKVTYRSQTYTCTTVDISEGGMLLSPRPDMDIPAQETIKIDMDKIGVIEAQVVSVSPKGLHVAFPEQHDLRTRIHTVIEETAKDNAKLLEVVRQGAAETARALEGALDRGEIQIGELFSNQYDPVANTEPRQFICKALPLYEKLFPGIIARALAERPELTYAVPLDRNGYCPTHSEECSQAQRWGDAEFNDRFSRNRRLELDDDTLAIVRSEQPYLIQRYRRLVAGEVEMLKDVSVPVFVKGRHWGTFRTGWPL
ncbi:MAG: methyl-accepting chemotaxis protein [Beijerinckiaceae bacterium]